MISIKKVFEALQISIGRVIFCTIIHEAEVSVCSLQNIVDKKYYKPKDFKKSEYYDFFP